MISQERFQVMINAIGWPVDCDLLIGFLFIRLEFIQ